MKFKFNKIKHNYKQIKIKRNQKAAYFTSNIAKEGFILGSARSSDGCGS
jgi:hypothetical protein